MHRPSLPLLFLATSLASIFACTDPPIDVASLTAPELFRHARCDTCHGGNRAGTFLGPPIQGIAANWERDALVEYIRDPKPVIESTPRLAAMAEKFASPMVGSPQLDRRAREKLADWVLKF